MQRTPEEIKKGLECGFCHECPYDNDEQETVEECARQVHKDAIAYIQQLESRLAQAERERDAAVRDCARFPCYTCAEKENGDFCPQCRTTGTFRALHEWRGPCPENTKEASDETAPDP